MKNREPLLTVAGVTGVIMAVFNIVAVYVPEITQVQEQVNTIAAFLAPIIVGVIGRKKVAPYTPMANKPQE